MYKNKTELAIEFYEKTKHIDMSEEANDIFEEHYINNPDLYTPKEIHFMELLGIFNLPLEAIKNYLIALDKKNEE